MKKTVLAITCLTIISAISFSQGISIPQIGAKAPSFTAETTQGTLHFPEDYGKSWKIVFSHPKDFTPVCSSEVLELAYNQETFNKLNTKVIVVSNDPLEQHRSWVSALEETNYLDRPSVKINFPIVDDSKQEVANLYGMIHSASSLSQNIRGVYFINPENEIKSFHFYPNEVGRSMDELLRTLEALQTTYAQSNVVTPANWEPGKDVMVPSLSQEDMELLGTAQSMYYKVAWFMIFKKII